MRRLLVLLVVLLIAPSATAGGTSAGQPVALVCAESSDEVFAVSLGPHGGRVLKRVRVDDSLMVAAPLHGPAVVADPHGA